MTLKADLQYDARLNATLTLELNPIQLQCKSCVKGQIAYAF